MTVSSDLLRARFAEALSDLYRREVARYGDLISLVDELHAGAGEADRARLGHERHGAIRLGTRAELATMRRLLAVLGMQAVGYYDLSAAGLPVHATAFRPVSAAALAASPFRLFCSLLRTDLIVDHRLRHGAESLLARRDIFTPGCLRLVERFEIEGALPEAKFETFISEALHTFRWRGHATVSSAEYDAMRSVHPLVADIACFPNPHLNHLTPRVLDIDTAQVAMIERGLPAKAVIEGPPRRAVPILLRQTAFLASSDDVEFTDGTRGRHAARFGEIEQRGIALTPKGRALYDALLARAGVDARAFDAFPDDLDTLRRDKLVWWRYRATPGASADADAIARADIETLLRCRALQGEPQTYEDFLPVSAAGIFHSNLHGEGDALSAAGPDRTAFEQALGASVLDEFALYRAVEDASLAESLRQLGGGGMTGLAARLRAELGQRAVLQDAADVAPYLASARHGEGRAQGVVRPATLAALSWTVAEFARSGEPFVVQGAATGLVAGATPSTDGRQWVLSTLSLRDVLEIDPLDRSAIVSAGYRLSDLNRAAAVNGLCFPVDLGADPSLGGMVATNTGGARLIRYGGVRENLLGVQGVLLRPPGQVVGMRDGLRKNNTGLDWRQLLCGTFGAFGLVGHAVVKLHALPRQTVTALLAMPSVEAAMQLLARLETDLGDFLTAFEGISGAALEAVVSHLPETVRPFQHHPTYAVLLELTTAVDRGQGMDLEALLLAWLERRMAAGDELIDAVVDKPARLWRLRHGVSEAVQHLGRMVAFDVAVKRSRFAALRARALAVVDAHLPQARVCDFGHLGDGGMHFNLVVPPATEPARIDAFRTEIYDLVVRQFGGSFSAEHGVGPGNAAFHRRYADDATRAWAAVLHAHFDPSGQSGNVRLDGVLD